LESGKPRVHDLLRKYQRDMVAEQVEDEPLNMSPVDEEKNRIEEQALFQAKERKAEEAMQALLADVDAEKARQSAHGTSKKSKKKKKHGRQATGACNEPGSAPTEVAGPPTTWRNSGARRSQWWLKSRRLTRRTLGSSLRWLHSME
jgi:hypothetical protein